MTSVSYEDVFSYFLGNVTDYNIASLSMSDAYELMSELLHKTVAAPYVRRLFSDILLDDEVQILSFTMTHPTTEDADLDFVKLVLSKGMVVEWITPQVRSKINIAQMFAGKEQKWFSQSNHISELRGMLEDTQVELRKIIRDRGYINNAYLEES